MHAEHLAMTERHVALGIGLIARQVAVVADLRRGGHDTEQAAELLQLLEETQMLHKDHRDRLCRELRELRD